MLNCLAGYRRFHNLPWPIRGTQTCVDCGQRFPSLVQFVVNPTFLNLKTERETYASNKQFHDLGSGVQRAFAAAGGDVS